MEVELLLLHLGGTDHCSSFDDLCVLLLPLMMIVRLHCGLIKSVMWNLRNRKSCCDCFVGGGDSLASHIGGIEGRNQMKVVVVGDEGSGQNPLPPCHCCF